MKRLYHYFLLFSFIGTPLSLFCADAGKQPVAYDESREKEEASLFEPPSAVSQKLLDLCENISKNSALASEESYKAIQNLIACGADCLALVEKHDWVETPLSFIVAAKPTTVDQGYWTWNSIKLLLQSLDGAKLSEEIAEYLFEDIMTKAIFHESFNTLPLLLVKFAQDNHMLDVMITDHFGKMSVRDTIKKIIIKKFEAIDREEKLPNPPTEILYLEKQGLCTLWAQLIDEKTTISDPELYWFSNLGEDLFENFCWEIATLKEFSCEKYLGTPNRNSIRSLKELAAYSVIEHKDHPAIAPKLDFVPIDLKSSITFEKRFIDLIDPKAPTHLRGITTALNSLSTQIPQLTTSTNLKKIITYFFDPLPIKQQLIKKLIKKRYTLTRTQSCYELAFGTDGMYRFFCREFLFKAIPATLNNRDLWEQDTTLLKEEYCTRNNQALTDPEVSKQMILDDLQKRVINDILGIKSSAGSTLGKRKRNDEPTPGTP